jgi:hypothetical protein
MYMEVDRKEVTTYIRHQWAASKVKQLEEEEVKTYMARELMHNLHKRR